MTLFRKLSKIYTLVLRYKTSTNMTKDDFYKEFDMIEKTYWESKTK